MPYLISSNTVATVEVRSTEISRLTEVITSAGGKVSPGPDNAILVTALEAPAIGELSLAAGIALHQLNPVKASLEDVFMELTADATEYHASTGQELA